MNESSVKIGILGGTFDPVHWGHLSLAMDAMEQIGLKETIFVPAKLQPFKLDKEVTPGEDRIAMLKLALEPFPGFGVSLYEMEEDGVSYTFLMMRAMREKYCAKYGEDCKLYFIIGTDSFLKIEKWRESEELLSNYAYIVGTRPGYKNYELKNCIERISRAYNTEVRNIDNVQIDISSTDVRTRLESGLSTADLIPDKVERYIKANGLYR